MIGDMLDEVCGGLRLAGPRPDQRGGEHDWLRTMAARTLRRLRGAGWLVAWDNPHGAPPDVLMKVVAETAGLHPDTTGLDGFVAWYWRTAIAALDESRADRNRRRHARLAETRDGRCPHDALAAGWPPVREPASYYRRRDRLAREAGYASFWSYRRAMGWSTGRERKTSFRQHMATLAEVA